MPLPKAKVETAKPPPIEEKKEEKKKEKEKEEEKAPASGRTAVIAIPPAKEPPPKVLPPSVPPPSGPTAVTADDANAGFSDIPTQAGLGPPVEGNPWENEVDDVDGPTAALVGGPPVAPPAPPPDEIDPAAVTQDIAPPAPPELSEDTSSMPRDLPPNDMLALQADTAQLEPLPPNAFQQFQQPPQWSQPPPPMQQPQTPHGFPPHGSHFPQPWQQQPMVAPTPASSSKTIVIIAVIVGVVLFVGLASGLVFVLTQR